MNDAKRRDVLLPWLGLDWSMVRDHYHFANREIDTWLTFVRHVPV